MWPHSSHDFQKNQTWEACLSGGFVTGTYLKRCVFMDLNVLFKDGVDRSFISDYLVGWLDRIVLGLSSPEDLLLIYLYSEFSRAITIYMLEAFYED